MSMPPSDVSQRNRSTPNRWGQALVDSIDHLARNTEAEESIGLGDRARAEKRLYELYYDNPEWDTEDLLDAAALFQETVKARAFLTLGRESLRDGWLRRQLEMLRRRERRGQ
jgi:hypothetical protein